MGFKCSYEEEKLHNNIAKAFGNLFDSKYEVHLNLGENKNYGIKNFYPDVVAKNKNNGEITIGEVKTSTYITSQVSNNQWVNFSNLVDYFTLIIPENKLEFVRFLINNNSKININELITYNTENNYNFKKVPLKLSKKILK